MQIVWEKRDINIWVNKTDINIWVTKFSIDLTIGIEWISLGIEKPEITLFFSWVRGERGLPWEDGLPWKDGEDGLSWKDWEDGNGIVSITLIWTVWKVKTYQILFTDSTTFNFDVSDWSDWEDWKEIELQKWLTHIQRKYVWDIDWIDLVALEDLKWDKWDTGEWIAEWWTTGQYLSKKSETNFDTEWKTLPDWSKREGDWLTHIKPKDWKKVNAEYINWLKTWTDFATRRTAEPTVHATETDYIVFKYTYWTTNYYRTVYNTYTPDTDIFYSEDTLENIIASRALSIT